MLLDQWLTLMKKCMAMKKLWLGIIISMAQIVTSAQEYLPEDYYVTACNEMSAMLTGRDSLSIKRAVFLAEWAFLEGELDYRTDFCEEIDRIVDFLNDFYEWNNLSSYKTGKQLALNEYFFRPYSGNHYLPYTYDYDTWDVDNGKCERQFVSRVLETHKGQCRSLPWLYKILAEEIGAEVWVTYAPRHCYIMYKDEDHFTPEEWVNLELTSHQALPSWWIKEDFQICDSAVIVGTYMTPLTNIQTVASQLADLAKGYGDKFGRYDEFTYYCATRSLEFHPMNPDALLTRGKSLVYILLDYLGSNGNIFDDYADMLTTMIHETSDQLDKTFMREETEEILERRRQRAMEARRNAEANQSPSK